MRAVLLVLAAPAAIALCATPASAQFAAGPGPGFAAAPGAIAQDHVLGDWRDGRKDRHRRRHRDFPVPVIVGGPWAWPEGWALYNNRGWEPESFNDWWHERPWRSYPRWMQADPDPDPDQKCERMWWSGGGWRC